MVQKRESTYLDSNLFKNAPPIYVQLKKNLLIPFRFFFYYYDLLNPQIPFCLTQPESILFFIISRPILFRQLAVHFDVPFSKDSFSHFLFIITMFYFLLFYNFTKDEITKWRCFLEYSIHCIIYKHQFKNTNKLIQSKHSSFILLTKRIVS